MRHPSLGSNGSRMSPSSKKKNIKGVINARSSLASHSQRNLESETSMSLIKMTYEPVDGTTVSKETKIFNDGISQLKQEQERLLKLKQMHKDKNSQI